MSNYATVAQLQAHVGTAVYDQLTDLAGGTTADDAVGQQRLDDAEAEINARLGQRYQTPVDVSVDASLANTLRWFTLAIAAYRAFMAHPSRPRARQTVQEEYRNVMARLEEIAKGMAALPGAVALPSPASSGPVVAVSGSDRVMTDEALSGL